MLGARGGFSLPMLSLCIRCGCDDGTDEFSWWLGRPRAPCWAAEADAWQSRGLCATGVTHSVLPIFTSQVLPCRHPLLLPFSPLPVCHGLTNLFLPGDPKHLGAH